MDGVLELAGVMLVLALFIVGLVYGILWSIAHIIDKDKNRPADEQLAGRFARGEIGEADYLRGLAILRHGPDLDAYTAAIDAADLVREPVAEVRQPGSADS